MKKEYKWEKRKRLSLRLSLKEGSLFIAIEEIILLKSIELSKCKKKKGKQKC